MDMQIYHFINFLPQKLKEKYIEALTCGKPVDDDDWLEFSHFISHFRNPALSSDEVKDIMQKLRIGSK